EGAGIEKVIGVEPTDELARGSAKALVEAIRLPIIWLAQPKRHLVFISTDEVDAPISGTAIDNAVLELWVILVEHRNDAVLEQIRPVVDGRDHANRRPFLHAIVREGAVLIQDRGLLRRRQRDVGCGAFASRSAASSC